MKSKIADTGEQTTRQASFIFKEIDKHCVSSKLQVTKKKLVLVKKIFSNFRAGNFIFKTLLNKNVFHMRSYIALISASF